MAEFKLRYRDAEGTNRTLEMSEQVLAHAANRNVSLRQYVNMMAAEDADKHGTSVDYRLGDAFEQAVLSAGLRPDAKRGEQPATYGALMGQTGGSVSTNFVAPDGTDTSRAAQLLFPQVILEAIASNLVEGVIDEGFMQKYNRMVGYTKNVAGALIQQPLINVRGPENADSQEIAQGAAPVEMLNISVSNTSYTIPTESIGLMVTEQALAATSLDFLGIIIARQGAGQRIRQAKKQLSQMINGDPNANIKPLIPERIGKFDPTITQAGQISKLGYLQWLRHRRFERTLDMGLISLPTAVALDDAIMKTVVRGPDAHAIQTPFSGVDLGIKFPEFLDLEDNILGGANRIVAIDSKHAIQRYINVSADYKAMQDFIMRRETGFRVDHGERAYRLFDEAWSVLDLLPA